MSTEKKTAAGEYGIVPFLNQWMNDILGIVLPGYLLMLLLVVIFSSVEYINVISNKLHPEWLAPVVSIGVAYLLGHFLVAFGERVVFKPIGWFCSLVRTHAARVWVWVRTVGDAVFPESMESEEALARTIYERAEFKAYRDFAFNQYKVSIPDTPTPTSVRILRNVALSATPEINPLTTKFTFLAILHGNVATVLVLIALAVLTYGHPWTLDVVLTRSARLFGLGLCAVFIYVHLVARYEHYRRSMTTPFSGALGRIQLVQDHKPNAPSVGAANPAAANGVSIVVTGQTVNVTAPTASVAPPVTSR